MLTSIGCEYTILGHSERRQYYGETDEKLVVKTQLALAAGLKVILCVGENLDEREAGKHFDVVTAQTKNVLYNFTAEDMKNVVIAYEPVWAIGTGKTATAAQAEEIHACIRNVIEAKFGAQVADRKSTLASATSSRPSSAPRWPTTSPSCTAAPASPPTPRNSSPRKTSTVASSAAPPSRPTTSWELPPVSRTILCNFLKNAYLCALKKAAKVFWCNGVRENRTE